MNEQLIISDKINKSIPFYAQPNDIAPKFRAEAYFNLEKKMDAIGLEDYRGKWVILFFYPSDFTYV